MGSILAEARALANAPDIDPIDKLSAILAGANRAGTEGGQIEGMHHQDHGELHLLMLKRLILELSPILAAVVQEGVDSGVFFCGRPLETIQLTLAGGLFLLDDAYFQWSEPEHGARLAALQAIVESAIGLEPGRLGVFGTLKPKDTSAHRNAASAP